MFWVLMPSSRSLSLSERKVIDSPFFKLESKLVILVCAKFCIFRYSLVAASGVTAGAFIGLLIGGAAGALVGGTAALGRGRVAGIFKCMEHTEPSDPSLEGEKEAIGMVREIKSILIPDRSELFKKNYKARNRSWWWLAHTLMVTIGVKTEPIMYERLYLGDMEEEVTYGIMGPELSLGNNTCSKYVELPEEHVFLVEQIETWDLRQGGGDEQVRGEALHE